MDIVVIDNSLRDKAGHHFEYDLAIAEAFRKTGNRVRLYGHRNLDPLSREELLAVPLFAKSEYERYGPASVRIPFLDFIFGNISIFRILNRARIIEEDPGVVFLHTITPKHMVGVFAWWTLASKGKSAALAMMLRFDIRNLRDDIAYRMVFWARRVFSRRVIFTTDSDALAERFFPLVGEKIHVLPIPHTPPLPYGKRGTTGNSDEIVVIFPGIAGETKGFQFLPDVVRRLLSEGIKIRFVIQTVMPVPTKALLGALEQLKHFGKEVRLIDHPLATEEYHRFLQESDCVLLAYDPDSYGGQTSGVFAEALALGKVVLATRTKWMERNMERFDTGVFIERYSPDGIADAICAYLEEREKQERRAVAASGPWRAHHNPDSFLEHLLRACGKGR